mgnify:CR=1 FL=1
MLVIEVCTVDLTAAAIHTVVVYRLAPWYSPGKVNVSTNSFVPLYLNLSLSFLYHYHRSLRPLPSPFRDA